MFFIPVCHRLVIPPETRLGRSFRQTICDTCDQNCLGQSWKHFWHCACTLYNKTQIRLDYKTMLPFIIHSDSHKTNNISNSLCFVRINTLGLGNYLFESWQVLNSIDYGRKRSFVQFFYLSLISLSVKLLTFFIKPGFYIVFVGL